MAGCDQLPYSPWRDCSLPHFPTLYFCFSCPPLIIIVSLQLSIYCHNSQRSIITCPSSAFYFVICECLNEKQHANKLASLGQHSTLTTSRFCFCSMSCFIFDGRHNHNVVSAWECVPIFDHVIYHQTPAALINLHMCMYIYLFFS